MDYWRAIVLYGLNVATYKIALARCLHGFVADGKTRVTMHELAAAFFALYLDRLRKGMPQLSNPSRLTRMETIVSRYRLGQVSESQAIDFVEQNAFVDVVPRFHTVLDEPVPVRFYEQDREGLVLTDAAFLVFESPQAGNLRDEVDSRWDLLEAAFLIRRDNLELVNDIRKFYLQGGYPRTDVTGMIPVLNGYQKGICFYCGEPMEGLECHVDHVLPRQVLQHDDVWNLVLAHAVCNQQKSDALPDRAYIDKLIVRNEHFIASNHPIKDELVRTLGPTPTARLRFMDATYDRIRSAIRVTWAGIPGYRPDIDPFYRSLIRSLAR